MKISEHNKKYNLKKYFSGLRIGIMYNISLEEIEIMVSDILTKCNIDSFLSVETIKMWMTELEAEDNKPYLTMVTGLLDNDTIDDSKLLNKLVNAVFKLSNLMPSRKFDGMTLLEEFEKGRKNEKPSSIYLSQIELPPSDWWLDYEKANKFMRQRKFRDAAKRFEKTFTTLLDSKTTWREIYRLYCNAGLAYLFSGDEILGVECIETAIKLNPNYTFAFEQLHDYEEGKLTPLIQMGFLQKMKDNIEERLESSDNFDLDEVMYWKESKIIRTLSKFDVNVAKEQFIELAKKVHKPGDIASKLFYPQVNVTGKEEDFIWMAAYSLWNIYCPNEPSVINLNEVIEEAFEFISYNSRKDIETDQNIQVECSQYIDRIQNIIFSGKDGFLEYWSKTYEYDATDRYDLQYFLTSLAGIKTYEKQVQKIANHLNDQIPHPDWNIVEISFYIYNNNPGWLNIYKKLRTRYPYNCYIASDVALIFEEINDLNNTEKYFTKALQIVDTRAKNKILSLKTIKTTIYEDYKFILDKLTQFYEHTKEDDKKRGMIKDKIKEVEDKSDIYSESPENERFSDKLDEIILNIEAENASKSCAIQYYNYLKQYEINFATKGEVHVDKTEIKIRRKDYENLDNKKIKKSKKITKMNFKGKTGKKIGRNTPCPCGSGKKYKKCCLNKGK